MPRSRKKRRRSTRSSRSSRSKKKERKEEEEHSEKEEHSEEEERKAKEEAEEEKITRHCKSGEDGCLACNSEGQCTACDIGYKRHEGSCKRMQKPSNIDQLKEGVKGKDYFASGNRG